MPRPPSFVPRSLLEHPVDFGVEADVTWKLASSLAGAARLARAVEQHCVALAVNRLLRRNRNSIADLARALGVREATLQQKLNGQLPASPEDLNVWLWLVDAQPSLPPLATLKEGGDDLPVLPLSRKRAPRPPLQ